MITAARAKRVTVLMTITLLVSLGLCGLNAAAYNYFGLAFSGGPTPGPHQHLKEAAGAWLILPGLLEFLGILVGSIGLVISLLAWLICSLLERKSDSGVEL